jgi:hypothetical protein
MLMRWKSDRAKEEKGIDDYKRKRLSYPCPEEAGVLLVRFTTLLYG